MTTQRKANATPTRHAGSAPWLQAGTLTGDRAILEPLSRAHAEDLRMAAADGELHRLWYTSAPPPERIEEEIERRLALEEREDWLQFATIDRASGRALGMTGYLHAAAKVRRVEIGGTWLAKSAQRTGINVETKLLLLDHAFEALDCIAVELRTSTFNMQSRRAIEALGAKQDGVLRNHYDAFGTPRDTCVYSIIASEWPNVQRHLRWRLAK
jgi:N-acetyltransferase